MAAAAQPRILLSTLPSTALEAILFHLPITDMIRLYYLTAKTITSNIIDSERMWSTVILHRLSRFLPAYIYFDGPPNTTNRNIRDLTGRERFPDNAQQCDDRLSQCINAIHAPEMKWTHGNRQLPRFRDQPDLEENLILVVDVAVEPGGTFGRRSLSEFATWAQTFQCEECHALGEAERQCAGCGELLCKACSIRCCCDESEDSPDAKCAFALCHNCHHDFSLFEEHPTRELIFDMTDPRFSHPLCNQCPFSTSYYCPLHIQAGVLECYWCGDQACSKHWVTGGRQYVLCTTCYCWHWCGDETCCPEGGEVLHGCPDCGGILCPDCMPDDKKCEDCGEGLEKFSASLERNREILAELSTNR